MTYQHKISSILVALNICEKRLLTIDEQINQFQECNGELVSDTEWRILELNKKQLTAQKIKEINDKEWFKILKGQYKLLFKDKDKIKNKDNTIDMDTHYPLLLDFTRKVLAKLKEQFP